MGRIGLAIVAIILLGLTSVVPACAQYTGALHTARPLEYRTTDVGPYIGLFDAEGESGTAVSAFGQARYGLFAAGDGGLKFGLVDFGRRSDVGLLLVGDLQWALLAPRWGDALWLSIGPEVGLYSVSDAHLWSFAGNLIASYDFEGNFRRISPYGRLTVRLEVSDNKHGSDTELQVGFNPGVRWEVSDFLDGVVEMQWDNRIGILAGLNFRL